jgi:hypothetical protein
LSNDNVNWTVSKKDNTIFLHLYLADGCEYTNTAELEQVMFDELIALSLQINQEPVQATELHQKSRIICMPSRGDGHGTFVIRTTVEDSHVAMEISQANVFYKKEEKVEVLKTIQFEPVELGSLMEGQYFRYVSDNIKIALEIHKVSNVQTSLKKGLVKVDCSCEPSVNRSIQATTKVYPAFKSD